MASIAVVTAFSGAARAAAPASRIARGRRERIVGAEDAGARDEDVDTRLGREMRVVDLDAAVDLDLARETLLVDHAAGRRAPCRGPPG